MIHVNLIESISFLSIACCFAAKRNVWEK